MPLRTKLSIRAKLALLAGVPMLGALLLALFVVRDATQRAASAASLGSIEDLARLTSYIADVLHAVQDERATDALGDSLEVAAGTPRLGEAAAAAARATDAAAGRLDAFLSTRDRSRLPARLARGLADTERALGVVAPLRARLDREPVGLLALLAGYRAASTGLVDATAALSELSDDGTMLRSISALVALLELEERASVEQSVVDYAASRGEFPPGGYKALVTATTEERVYDEALRTSASDDVRAQFDEARERGRPAREMLDALLGSTEDAVTVAPAVWDQAQGLAVRELRTVERGLLDRVETAAASKARELRKTIRLSVGVSIAVVLLSLTLAVFLGQGVQGSVRALTDAAEKVRSSRDFSVRARRMGDDELGMLTETFNEMLAGIQDRDAELVQHRSQLEQLVVARTRQLAMRNDAMRLVLDNVDQGLATVGLDGALHSERSSAFDRWFLSAREAMPFADALLSGDENLRLMMKLGWDQVADGILPAHVAVEQLPKRFDDGGRHFTLTVKIITDADAVVGALLVVTDVTAELDAERQQARQREEIQVFRRVAGDRAAFVAFLEETGGIVDGLRRPAIALTEQLGLVHTVKGNAAQYDIRSVADVAHALESAIVDSQAALGGAEMAPLFEAWEALVGQVAGFVGTGEAAIELSRGELDRLIQAASTGLSASQIAGRLRMLFDEPVAARFARLGEHAERLAVRLGKPVPTFTVRTDDLRLPRQGYAPFWTALVHVVRNAVDHGIESAAARASAGKPSQGRLSFRARLDATSVVVEIADDGPGIDWKRLEARALAAGLPCAEHADIERALFASGISSRERVTEVSGRGVGLAAVWSATVGLGGTVRVESIRGRETRFVFRLPIASASHRSVKGLS
jgi:two-component system chemotaxis sensor kinase CheA